jgi:uncharacterized protein (TIGR04255 family)
MAQLPKKLRKDAIIEALVQLQFETDEAPEIVIGRLTDNPKWVSFKRTRTAFAELPSMIRLSDPNLRFQPHFDLREERWNVKVGTNVVSLHVLDEYCGWGVFRPAIAETVNFLFSRISKLSVRRIGLRYINNLNATDHQIGAVSDLNLELRVAGAPLTEHVNLNYRRTLETGQAMVRIASPDIVEGPKRQDMTAYVDVDVFTHDAFNASDPATVIRWIEDAHTAEKTEFFRLLPDNVIEAIKEA